MALRACALAAPSRDVRARSSSKMRGPRRAKKSRFKASQLPPGCLRCRHHRRAVTATRFRIRERLRIACALPLLTVFKFVAIMRHSAANGKWNTAMRRSAPALRRIDDASRCVESGVEMWRRAARVDGDRRREDRTARLRRSCCDARRLDDVPLDGAATRSCGDSKLW